MTTISISELKTNPTKAIFRALDYPVAIEKRNNIEAYLIGKDLYEKIIAYLEDFIDSQAIKKADFSKGKDFEKVARNLEI